jgi:hypothetical protein
MLAERLSKAWDERQRSTLVDPVMKFTAEGLVLGAGTVLIPSGGSGRERVIEPVEPKLRALLTAAHLGQPSMLALGHLRKAVERWSEGEDRLAAMHLALSRVDHLERPVADAQRLFLADGLLKDGIEADVVIAAITAGGPAFEQLQKYDPDQPRVPAGSGKTSGEWTSGGGGSSTSQQAEVNPSTITPAAYSGSIKPAATYYGKDACERARKYCRANTLNDALAMFPEINTAANDNGEEKVYDKWKKEESQQCDKGGFVCETLSLIVNYTPFIQRSAVRFPDGGLVISEKGWEEDLYIPRGNPRGAIPPMRRR